MTSTAYETSTLDVLTEAFLADPVTGWLLPDETDRRRLQPAFYRSLLAHPGAEVYLSDDAGAAIWLALDAGRSPYDEQPDGADPTAVFGANAARMLTIGRLLAERHPLDRRHLYLACLGVLPTHQGAGLGSAMLRDRLARADTERLPAYLEASSAGSRALYLRHGFQPFGEPIELPDGPTLWPMWRKPQPEKGKR